MKRVSKKIALPISQALAFELFITRLHEWWPKEYTWSQEKLADITIDPRINGLCTETGPFAFRCDWGRVTAITEPEHISFKWQISPERVPVPDPSKCSEISVKFKELTEQSTEVHFEHFDFEFHGEGADAYAEAMDSPQGWDYILKRYKDLADSLAANYSA